MSIFGRWFRKSFSRFTEPALSPPRDLAALLEPHCVPAAQVIVGDAPSLAGNALAVSQFGGIPALPASLTWPTRNGKPLSFLAQISLAELQASAQLEWLPQTGCLLFFYDTVMQPWGRHKDRGGWSVLYTPVALRIEQGPRPSKKAKCNQPPLVHRSLTFRKLSSIPGADRDPVEALRLDDTEIDRFFDLIDQRFGGLPRHQIGGFPHPVQADLMEFDCHFESQGLSARAEPREHPQAAGAQEWKLLLQIDTDPALNVMWGDAGTIYFFVQEQRARVADFSNVWLVLQCH